MKFNSISKGLLLGLTLLLATSVFAANANKGSLQTMSDVTVSGKTIPAGEYSLKWEGTGSNVQVSILKGKTVVATTPARLVEMSQSPSTDSAVVKTNGDGSRSLTEVRFGGKKYALQIAGETVTDEAAGSTK